MVKKTLAILFSLALVICMIPATVATAWATETLVDQNVTLSPDSVLYTGSDHTAIEKVTVTVKNSAGISLTKDTDYEVAWLKDGASVNAPKEAGTYTLKVTGKSNYVGEVTKTYIIKQVNLDNATIKCDPLKTTDFEGWGDAQKDATVTLPSGKAITVKIGSETVATEIYKTEITKINDYRIQVQVSPASGQNDDNITGTRYATFNVPTDLDDAYKVVGTNGAAIPAATYTGYALTPAVYVVPVGESVDLSKRLTEGTDYKVSYSNNIYGNSNATVTITGMNRYSGTVTGTFHINGKSISGCTINVGSTVQGAAPVVTVYDGSKRLTEGTDYKEISSTIYNTNNVGSNAGTITIEGTGNYAGTKAATFKVVAAANNIGSMEVYQGSTKLTSTSNLSGTYNYYTGSSLPAQNITVYTNKTTSSTLSTYNYDVVYEYTDANGNIVSTTAPVNAKTYTVYVIGKNDYAGKKQIGTYTILPHKMSKYDLNISVSMASATAEPAVTVRSAYYTNTVFTKGTDYTVYASSYTYNGKRTVTISSNGTGNLASGSISDSYPVVSKSISSCTVSFKDGKTSTAYTGYTIPVQIVVKDGLYTTLSENQQYTVTYKNEEGKAVSSIKDAGRYTIEITGKNGYTGTTYLYFMVGDSIISADMVYAKTGQEITVNVDLSENTGLASMLIKIDYDEDVLEFLSAENGEIFDTESFLAPQNDNRVKTLLWQNGTIKENIVKTGKLATLKFKVKEGVNEGTTKIGFVCDSERYEAVDSDMNAVNVIAKDAEVRIVSFFYGDVDDNDTVDLSDVLYMKRYLAEWNGYAINEEAADLDSDGIITLRDITILQRHIAGWTGYETLPVTEPQAS